MPGKGQIEYSTLLELDLAYDHAQRGRAESVRKTGLICPT